MSSLSLSPPSLCRQVELLRRKERNEAHLFMSVEVYLEDDFQSHQNADLLDFEEAQARYY